jgi:hypothetical protein
MFFIPYYDEFLIYTTEDEILEFIESIIKKGLTCKEDIIDICIEHFGKNLDVPIKYIVYEFEFENKELQSV